MRIRRTGLFALLLASAFAPAEAAQIHFTGGTVHRLDGTTETTNNNINWDNVDYYEEAGFKLDFIGNVTPFATNLGDYYAVGNDVIHGHWATGNFGEMTKIEVTKLDGSAFDLNYFILTSNTDVGGSPASGNEQVLIHASIDGTTSSYSQLLPSEDWGFPATQIFLGPQFDGIKAFWFEAVNPVDCFGMDTFFIDEPAPPAVPEPGTWALIAVGIAGAALRLRK